jgi:hypothetical protein
VAPQRDSIWHVRRLRHVLNLLLPAVGRNKQEPRHTLQTGFIRPRISQQGYSTCHPQPRPMYGQYRLHATYGNIGVLASLAATSRVSALCYNAKGHVLAHTSATCSLQCHSIRRSAVLHRLERHAAAAAQPRPVPAAASNRSSSSRQFCAILCRQQQTILCRRVLARCISLQNTPFKTNNSPLGCQPTQRGSQGLKLSLGSSIRAPELQVRGTRELSERLSPAQVC